MPNPLAPLAFGDLGHRAATDHRQRLLLEDIRIARAACVLVFGFDQKPRLLFLSRPAVHAHEMPAPVQLLALKAEIEMTFLVSGVRVTLRIPLPAIPNHDRAGAVLRRGDGALECVVFDRMIFDVDRQAFFARNEAWAARHGPALHYSPEFQPQVVVQPPRCMFLDDELMSLRAVHAPPRLRRDVELALPAIDLKAHCSTRTLALCRSGREREAIPRRSGR